jgi:hypothetical protein
VLIAEERKDDNGKALGPQDNAYMRATRFDERRKLHDAWALFAATRRRLIRWIALSGTASS